MKQIIHYLLLSYNYTLVASHRLLVQKAKNVYVSVSQVRSVVNIWVVVNISGVNILGDISFRDLFLIFWKVGNFWEFGKPMGIAIFPWE